MCVPSPVPITTIRLREAAPSLPDELACVAETVADSGLVKASTMREPELVAWPASVQAHPTDPSGSIGAVTTASIAAHSPANGASILIADRDASPHASQVLRISEAHTPSSAPALPSENDPLQSPDPVLSNPAADSAPILAGSPSLSSLAPTSIGPQVPKSGGADPIRRTSVASINSLRPAGHDSIKPEASQPVEATHFAIHSAGPENGVAGSSLSQGAAVAVASASPLDSRGLSSLSATSNAGQAPGGDVFRSMDGDTGLPSGAWIHAGSHRAEAGYLDPALGWIGVRAEASAGGVHASLVPSSADAAQILGGHLGDLNSFLSERHAQPATVTLAGAETGSNSLASGADSHGAGQGNSRADRGYEGQPRTLLPDTPIARLITGTHNAGPAEFHAWPAGEHISVLA
jgi:hypothetical protein